MARKTRKQKIASQKRNITPSQQREATEALPAQSKKFSVVTPTRMFPSSDAETALKKNTLKDIGKTLLIISLLFTIQSVVYGALQKGYLAHIFP